MGFLLLIPFFLCVLRCLGRETGKLLPKPPTSLPLAAVKGQRIGFTKFPQLGSFSAFLSFGSKPNRLRCFSLDCSSI